MAKAGEVRVRLTRDAAAAAAHWLSMHYIPAYQAMPRLLGVPRQEHITRLNALVARFHKAGCAKRGKEFTALLSREMVAEMVVATHRNSCSMHIAPPQVWQMAVAMRKAAASRKGRHELSVSEVEDRVQGRFHVSQRMRQDAEQRKRNSEKWMKFIRDSGSLLASRVPLPRKTP